MTLKINSLENRKIRMKAYDTISELKNSGFKRKHIIDKINIESGIPRGTVRNLLKQQLEIEARYSIQKPNKLKNKQTVYHLRIYKKDYVRKFLQNISTTKLKEEKKQYVTIWLNNGK